MTWDFIPSSKPTLCSIKDRRSVRKGNTWERVKRPSVDSHPWERRSYLDSYIEAVREIFYGDVKKESRQRRPYYRDYLDKLVEWKQQKMKEREFNPVRQIIRVDASAGPCQLVQPCLRTPNRKRKHEDMKNDLTPVSYKSAITPQGDRRSRTPHRPKKEAKRPRKGDDLENPFALGRKTRQMGLARRVRGTRRSSWN